MYISKLELNRDPNKTTENCCRFGFEQIKFIGCRKVEIFLPNGKQLPVQCMYENVWVID